MTLDIDKRRNRGDLADQLRRALWTADLEAEEVAPNGARAGSDRATAAPLPRP